MLFRSDGFEGGVAQGQEHALGFVGLILAKQGQCLAECLQAEIRFALGAFDSIQERAQIDQFRPGFQII